MFPVLALDARGRQKRPVTHLLYGDGAVVDGIDPPFHDGVFNIGVVVDLDVDLLEHFVRILPLMFQKAHELVRLESAADASLPNLARIHFCNFTQQPVSCRYTENGVDQFKIFNIRADDIIVLLRASRQYLFHLPVEKLLAVEAREPVIPKLIDHGRVFPQIDDIGHPVQDHLRLIGLGYKVRGPLSQS